MDKKILKALEYDKIMERVASYASSVDAKEKLRQFLPCNTLEESLLELSKTQEADKIMYVHGVFPSFDVDNIEDCLYRAEKLSMLNMSELLKVARVLRTSRLIRTSTLRINEDLPLIKSYAGDIFMAESLEKDIGTAILSDTEISDNASSALANIRRTIRKTNARLRDKLNYYITSSEYSKHLQDNIITQRENRYVIPVKSEARGKIKGLVHDQSASGQTVYIEPIAIVEMNNQLKTLMFEENKEIERILREFTVRIGVDSRRILQNCQIVVELDMVFARAMYSHEIKAICPALNDKGHINIKKGRHPLIPKDVVVPITIRLGYDYNILLITGPNTGGKTVTLKLTGLLVLMASSGLFIPAGEGSEISFFSQVFCDIGDEQSIEQNLSTFSSHIKNIVNILDNFDSKSLILLDELGAGTDPEEGASLAVSITDYLVTSGAFAVITTHYSLLKEYSYTTDKIENACMDFDPLTFEPTYKLIIGVPGTSNALEIAKRLGLNEQVIINAQKNLTHEKVRFEEVLQSADIVRRKAEEEEQKYTLLNQELQEEIRLLKQEKNTLAITKDKLNINAKREIKRRVDNALIEVNDIVEELKEMLKNPNQGSYFDATKLRKRIESINIEEDVYQENPTLSNALPQPGDRVFVQSIKKSAVLDAITAKGEYIVKIGNIKTTVGKGDIKKLQDQKTGDGEVKGTHKPTKSSHSLHNVSVTREIKLLGQAVDEAIYNLSQFIDESVLSQVDEIKIIHGIGTGKLKRGIWEYLNSQGCILSYREGKYREGGQGVTLARLK